MFRWRVRLLDVKAEGTQDDSTCAAALLAEMGVGCIITLGGDGTNRVVAKACHDIPLVPISTGTNNVFPYMIEGTVAGLAAGVVASGRVDAAKVCRRAPILELLRNNEPIDLALIDLVVTEDAFHRRPGRVGNGPRAGNFPDKVPAVVHRVFVNRRVRMPAAAGQRTRGASGSGAGIGTGARSHCSGSSLLVVHCLPSHV